MAFMRLKRILIFIISLCVIYVGIHWLFKKNDKVSQHFMPTVLWWTELLPEYHRTRQCGMYKCLFTVRRRYLQEESPMAIVFYGSDMNITDFPVPRLPHHVWALMHEESPKNVPYIQFETVLKHFNVTATFSRYSDFPLTTQYIESIEKLTTKRFLVPIGEKTKLRKTQKLASVAFVQSICDTMSGRDEYVQELMNYIAVDSYGKCLNNKNLPESLSGEYLRTIDTEEFYRFLARYKFIIGYENGVCDDYITEKFWRPLFIGSIPVYFGAPTIKDWMPNNKSAILISDFDSPKALADYLKFLDENDYEYNKYLDHKYSQVNPISNERLKSSIMQRGFKNSAFFEDFECFMCEKLYNGRYGIADKKHYDCDHPLRFPKMKASMKDNHWHHVTKYGRCQAEVLNKFLLRNKNFTQEEFNESLTNDIQHNICIL